MADREVWVIEHQMLNGSWDVIPGASTTEYACQMRIKTFCYPNEYRAVRYVPADAREEEVGDGERSPQ